jgi:hypothetical protein
MAKVGIKVDNSGLRRALGAAALTADDLQQIESAGQYVLINGMRARVAVASGATRASIMPHIVEHTDTRIVDEVGPETVYAPAIEYGRPDMPGYPEQPFIRPTVEEDGAQVQSAVGTAFGTMVKERWSK